ncbi:MAG: hypothetical protein ACO295_05125 [Sediminibacterium sp.]
MTIDFSDFLEALEENNFVETPVDVRTFVTSKDYLGLPELSEYQYTLAECMSQIYKEEDLIRLMGEKEGKEHYKKYTKQEVILMCGKGSGKDHTSTVGCAYLVYKLLCLKDPSRYFGKPSNDAIDLINVAVNAEQAKNVFFKGFKSKIENSPWFAGKYESKVNNIEFDKAITVYSGHSERESAEGLNLMLAVLDEISAFSMEGSGGNEQGKTADNLYKAFRGSVDSRFPDFGKVILLSFPRYKGDFISKRYEDVIADKETIVKTHEFVINPELSEEDPANKFGIEWEEDIILSYKLPGVFALRKPTWEMNPTRTIENFKKAFYTDPADALMRFACMPTIVSDSFFKSRDKVERALSIRNPLDNSRRFDFNFKPKQEVVYYVHADLAQKHDKCAVSIAHVDKWVTIQSFNNYEQIVPMIVVDAIAWWEPKREGPVDLSEVKNWIIDLRRQGFNLGLVTFDRWQSFDIQQELKSVGIKTETLSVAKKHYEDLAMLIYEDRVAAPHIDILLEELLELRIMGNRVDHPRKKSKDLADAMCGSVYNAIAHSQRGGIKEIEIHTWTRGGVESDRYEERDKIKSNSSNWRSGFRIV